MTHKGKANVEKAIKMLLHVQKIKGNGEDVEAGLNLVLLYVSNAIDTLQRKNNLSQQTNK